MDTHPSAVDKNTDVERDSGLRRDPSASPDTDLVDEELLVEEISIDGMCGVY